MLRRPQRLAYAVTAPSSPNCYFFLFCIFFLFLVVYTRRDCRFQIGRNTSTSHGATDRLKNIDATENFTWRVRGGWKGLNGTTTHSRLSLTAKEELKEAISWAGKKKGNEKRVCISMAFCMARLFAPRCAIGHAHHQIYRTHLNDVL